MQLLSNTGLVLDISIISSIVALVYFSVKLAQSIFVKKTSSVCAVLQMADV